MMSDRSFAAVWYGIIAACATTIVAYVNHLLWTISMLMANAPLEGGKLALAFIGIIFPPLGVLHGAWLWFH